VTRVKENIIQNTTIQTEGFRSKSKYPNRGFCIKIQQSQQRVLHQNPTIPTEGSRSKSKDPNGGFYIKIQQSQRVLEAEIADESDLGSFFA